MFELADGRGCPRCNRILPRAAFAKNKAMRDGLQAYCRECSAEYYRQRQEARGKTVRAKVPAPRGHKRCPQCGEIKAHSEQSYFKRKYGITLAERGEMIASRMGLCAICSKAPAVHVDHCHETGRVRGVTCFNCNSGIGLLRDDPAAVYRAADYLEGNAWKPTLVAPGVYQLPS
ncbi:endonuclease VII domain-containing protein [Streptomyces prunicolor]|uniref:endonuclease VII domain-containing protein n=1 Tax=Streptomyces prunicolor TaxID=67348 RepID=UPI00386FD512|nr:endonuclease VII domain-containing protein [Streptomyces prunicolor]